MKKLLVLLLCFAMVFSLAACGGNSGGEVTDNGYDSIADTSESEDGTYELAFVTDVGQLKDGSFNQFTWNGVKKYASDNSKTYKYYQPANSNNATDEDRYKAMADAVEAGAKIVVAAGFLQETSLKRAAETYPNVHFVFVDGWDLGLDNVASISYKEEQAGYFAGYAAVMEGLTKLGFSGGGGGTNPACQKYGYGFLQGAEAAAKEKNAKIDVTYSWLYGSSFSASDDLQAMLNGWFKEGTEAVFMCGGSMFQSGVAAAEANDAKIIGVDVDQSGDSETVITSAMKDLAGAVIQCVEAYYGGNQWKGVTVLGAKENCVGIPTDTWQLANWTVEDYNALFEKVKAGEIEIDDTLYPNPTKRKWENLTIKFID